ncbi:tetratricopeptide repeat protein [Marinicella gelatinilytica]|uniref:tetratricopeptide repeat protein n=1 Tax=Marinicella gelatinilytica TaxID=2996017 RepID=UPI0022608513|nr:tetratricopeptide repeat protein [Marinicella gelatinilytica]MCX7545326.1 tetratricopeptide repeat protein [Marinicella gelatinilytica]
MNDLEQIKKQHQKGQLKKAIDGYQSYLKKNPNDDEAHFGLALAYKDNKLFNEALKSATSAVQLAPNAERYHQFKGQMHMALGDSEAALQAFRTSLKHNPNLYFSYLAIGDIFSLKEQFQDAEEQYRLALRVHQDATPAAVKLAKLLLLTGRVEEADSVLQAAALHQPKDPQIKLYQGIINLEAGEFAFAELHFKKLLEDNPEYPLAKIYLAISLMDNDLRQAADHLNQLIEAKHQSPELLAAVGMLSLKQKHYNEAVNYLVSACRSTVAYPSWYMALSQGFVAMNRLPEAKQVLQQVLRRSPNDRATVMLGLIELRAKQYPQAIEHFTSISTDSPRYPAALKHIMQAYFQSKNWQKTIASADQLLALNPDHGEAIVMKSHAFGYLNDLEQALATLEIGLSNDNLSAIEDNLHLNAGLILDAQGEYESAWQHFSAQQTESPKAVALLSKDEEKTAQKWPSEATEIQPVFVFSDTSTGHAAFVEGLQANGIEALTDRFRPTARQDLFFQQWLFPDIDGLPEARCHLLRKKYQKHLKRIHNQGPFADFIPTTALNMALLKKVFPSAKVIMLDRNMADRHLHQLVFANSRYSANDFRALKNQMIAMNPNIHLLDIDAFLDNDKKSLAELSDIFKVSLTAQEPAKIMPMQQLMLPKNRWKAYSDHLKTKP